ncbi:DUF2262 domain-containing protein [Paenibacillus sp. IHBB 10380]|uniref:DUF2262 domain-containing protein n=1 Tax=Paenibacillus sp. IHBB 10380 TaxID=1566358 RepID=UPI0005CF99A2|nr:DUF2262 domain-containing protein [Paenibacillus sp. IHBB 10380]AJS58817.1 hypothetical protein UB51_10410 [Paenibacillus sp. IHBB 10380]
MDRVIKSELIGVFVYEGISKAYSHKGGDIHWSLDMRDESADFNEMMKRAEKLFLCIQEFDENAKLAITDKLINYKNDFWPEYDENDESLNWDDVDAGKYDVTKEKFERAITLLDIVINDNNIYCEYDDGGLFGGHRIHVYFNNKYKLLSADI